MKIKYLQCLPALCGQIPVRETGNFGWQGLGISFGKKSVDIIENIKNRRNHTAAGDFSESASSPYFLNGGLKFAFLPLIEYNI